jgi:Holliday junction resolvasome RuvABC endonuclease subunit
MVQTILKVKIELNLDTSDALAAAICHLNWSSFESIARKANGAGRTAQGARYRTKR